MPFSDALLNLVPYNAALSLVGLPTARSNVVDFLGQGQGTAPQNIIGNTTLYGQPDAFGIGLNRLELEIATGSSAFVGTGVSLNIALQYAADLGTPTYLPSTWFTAVETGAIAVANLTASTYLFKSPMVPPPPGLNRPRFFSLLFTMTGGTFTTGSIAFALLTPSRDDLVQKFAAKNFTV